MITQKTNGIECKIRNASEAKMPTSYNLIPNRAKKEAFLLHKSICKELVALCDEHNVPMGYLVYFAVGKDAHKTPIIEKGYKRFDKQKALTIIEMAKFFAEYHKITANDKVYHAVTKFYQEVSTDVETFKTIISQHESNNGARFESMTAIFHKMVVVVEVAVTTA